jgi:hypothetical protein
MNPILLIDSEDTPLLRMTLAPSAGNEARELFLKAAQDFERGIDDTITFDPGYQLQEGECFEIKDFAISDDLTVACKQPLSANRLNKDQLANLSIKSIVGYDFSDRKERIFFQNFDSRRVLIPGRGFAVFATADSSTFKELEAPVVLLDAQLAAIWDKGTLKFRNFNNAKKIFDLTSYFTEATDEQIGEFVAHSFIACEDKEKLIKNSTAWSRKKIALILHGKALDSMTARSVRAAAKLVEYDVPMSGNKIALPSDKKELKALLQFLDDDLYLGPISKRRLLSSGKRELSAD